MSYSRWINSPWYTWHDVSGGMGAWLNTSPHRPVYTHAQVHQMLDGEWSPMVDDITEEQRAELREYMLEYAYDADPVWTLENKREWAEELVRLKIYLPEILEPEWLAMLKRSA